MRMVHHVAAIGTVVALASATVPASTAAAVTPAAASSAQSAEQAAFAAKIEAILKSLHPQFGDVAISAAHAGLALGKDYYFLPAAEAKRVLTEAWGNPPDSVDGVLGMIFPAGKHFADDTWGAVITYEDSGHVSDADAGTAKYDEVIAAAHDGEGAMNEERTKQGFPAQHLVGWAEPPTYDAKSHSLIWARNISFFGEPTNTLNYDIRMLGRSGVLSVNMVSTMPHLAEIREAAKRLAFTASFDAGSRYADFNPDTDSEAGYGLAGLVAASVGVAAAKKAGLLAGLLLFGKKFTALIIAAGAGLFAWVRKRMGGPSDEA